MPADLFCTFIKESQTVIFIGDKGTLFYEAVEELSSQHGLVELVVRLLTTLQETCPQEYFLLKV